MALNATEECDEILRKQCENASLQDGAESTKSVLSKPQLPPIKLGMSFSDWKLMKDAERDSQNTKSGNKNKKPQTAQKGKQYQRFNRQQFDSSLQGQNNDRFRSQQQNFSNYNLFPPFPNLQQPHYDRSFCDDPVLPSKIPPLLPPPSFDEFCFDDSPWSSGPLMQPLFPPMPQMPRIPPQQGRRINTSVHHNNRNLGQKRSSARSKPQSKQTNSNTSPNLSKPINSTGVDGKQTEVIQTKPQVYILRKETVIPRWVVRPAAPPPMDADTPETPEEKGRLWREYRKAMKPFKNREFLNAKRVVQRLGKKNYDELDEKERERLARALEAVNSHKAMLNSHKATLAEKYGRNNNAEVQQSVHEPPRLTESFVSGGVYLPTNPA